MGMARAESYVQRDIWIFENSFAFFTFFVSSFFLFFFFFLEEKRTVIHPLSIRLEILLDACYLKIKYLSILNSPD